MSSDQVLKAAIPMLSVAEAAAAVGASLRLRREDRQVAPELRARLDAVLDAVGIRDAVDGLQAHESLALLGIVEGFLTQAADFVAEPGRSVWDHDDARILSAQGHTSVLVAGALRGFIVPSIGGDLAQRLDEPGGSFLDVGSGVAALAIAMCRIWPSLRVVGVDSWPPAMTLAREAVTTAGLEERVELHEGTIESLDMTDRFDLAWIPTFFIAAPALTPALERVHAAMRPGGWVTLGLYARPGDPFADALADLRTVRHGGTLITPQDAAQLLEDAGFGDVAVHFDAEWKLPLVFVAGRRAAAS